MERSTLSQLIEKGLEISKNEIITGIPGMEVYTYEGIDFEEWKTDLSYFCSKITSKSFKKKLTVLISNFGGWNDKSNLNSIIGTLRSLEKNIDSNFVGKISNDMKRELNMKNTVFVIYGRNEKIRKAMFTFLRAIGVEPLEWGVLKTEPLSYIGEILENAFSKTQAVIVLLTPDDEAKLRDQFIRDEDDDYERKLTPQARPNVLFEAGIAIGKMEERTILIEFGNIRKFSDIEGRHRIKFNADSSEKRMEIINHLKMAGVEFDYEGKTDWITAGDFN